MWVRLCHQSCSTLERLEAGPNPSTRILAKANTNMIRMWMMENAVLKT